MIMLVLTIMIVLVLSALILSVLFIFDKLEEIIDLLERKRIGDENVSEEQTTDQRADGEADDEQSTGLPS